MRFSALFGKVSGQTALSSLQLLKDNFSGASWPGLERPLHELPRRCRKRSLRFSVHIQDKNFKPFADVIALAAAHSPQIF